jgi:hypothetical protein
LKLEQVLVLARVFNWSWGDALAGAAAEAVIRTIAPRVLDGLNIIADSWFFDVNSQITLSASIGLAKIESCFSR